MVNVDYNMTYRESKNKKRASFFMFVSFYMCVETKIYYNNSLSMPYAKQIDKGIFRQHDIKHHIDVTSLQ
jgi:hypothetical protein